MGEGFEENILCSYISNPRHFKIMENLFLEERNLFHKYKRARSKMMSLPMTDRDDLLAMSDEAVEFLEDFLEMEVPRVQVKRSNAYSLSQKKNNRNRKLIRDDLQLSVNAGFSYDGTPRITLDSDCCAQTGVPLLVHELAHALQLSNMPSEYSTHFPYLLEGHARILEREAALTLAERYRDPMFAHHVMFQSMGEISAAYQYALAKNGKEPHDALADRELPLVHLPYYSSAAQYWQGHGALAIAMEKEGPAVLRQVLESDFSFLE